VNLNLPTKAAENQRKKILKCTHPIEPMFSNSAAVDFDTETLCTKVTPKLHREKQSRVAKHALLSDDPGFLTRINMAREAYRRKQKKCI
jgi:hypothetical protein